MRSDRLLWIVLGIIGVAAVLLMMNHDSGQTLGLDNNNFASLVYLGAIGLVIGLAVVSRARPGGNFLQQVAIWLALFVGLVVAYKLYQGQPLFPGDRPVPPDSGTGITASLMDRVDSNLHLLGPFNLG